MQHQLVFFIAMGFSGVVNAADRRMDNNPDFELTASCQGQAPCIFRARDVHFDISVKNLRDTPIHLPVEFMRNAGPMIELHDNREDRSTILPSPIRDGTLLSNLTVVAPGQSVLVSGTIPASSLEQWGGTEADITAVATLGAPLDGSAEFGLVGVAQLRVLGSEAAE